MGPALDEAAARTGLPPMKTISTDPPVSRSQAVATLARWAQTPVPLRRPVLLCPGWTMPHFALDSFYRALLACTTNGRGSIHRRAIHLLRSLTRVANDLADCMQHQEVDVVAQSMGGIVAREAARKHHRVRLQISRLFTLATPHGGARIAASFIPHHQAQACRSGSPYLADLNDDPSSRDFPMTTYRLQGDIIVPRDSAHLVGDEHHDWPRIAWWMPAHSWSQWDERLVMVVVGKLLGHIQ